MLFFDKLFSKNNNVETTTGKKIRQLRYAKHISAKDLGAACGVNEAAIRNYEQGIRQVSTEKLALIANFLGVTPSALYDRKIDTYSDVMHILFELEDNYELLPVAIPQEPRYALLSKDEVLVGSLRVWYEQRRKWERKEITLDQLKEWKNTFPLSCEEDIVNHGDDGQRESAYTEFERIIFLKRALEDQNRIANEYNQLIRECLKRNDSAMAERHNDAMQKTMNMTFKKDIEKYG